VTPPSAVHEAVPGTIAAALTGRARGFDSLRLGLAFAILAFHSVTITHGNADAIPPPLMAAAHLILPMFFAMSGFLVAASLARAGSVLEFVLLRLLRLLPGLLTVLLLTVLFLGPLLAETGPARYFASPAVAIYFGNLLGWPVYGLPGLFLHNPRAGIVNGSLWTIRIELLCYAGLTVCALMRSSRRWVPWLLTAGIVLAWQVWRDPPAWPRWFPVELGIAFLSGTLIFKAAPWLPLHPALGLGMLILAFMLSLTTNDMTLAAVPAAYATVWLGLARAPALPGDYAYGVYLVGYPLAQSIVLLLPQAAWWQTLTLCAPLALGLAMLLWHRVERPALASRPLLIGLLPRPRSSPGFGLAEPSLTPPVAKQ
jgi:peptidoglycan/LPS O-acetylase OafA/YrhL